MLKMIAKPKNLKSLSASELRALAIDIASKEEGQPHMRSPDSLLRHVQIAARAMEIVRQDWGISEAELDELEKREKGDPK